MGVGSLSDGVVLVLARRNKGYKEPEMRIWTYVFPLIFGAVGYFLYGWAATNGDHWMAIAVALCCLIAQQVSITSMATAYAMECFDGVSNSEFVSFIPIFFQSYSYSLCSRYRVNLSSCSPFVPPLSTSPSRTQYSHSLRPHPMGGLLPFMGSWWPYRSAWVVP
jgi:hypothetical protein